MKKLDGKHRLPMQTVFLYQPHGLMAHVVAEKQQN